MKHFKIDDKLFRDVLQISNEANRYIDKFNSIEDDGFYLPKKFMNDLLGYLNNAMEPWYDLYKGKAKKYNVDTNYKYSDEEAKNKGAELRKLRVEKGLFIEEVCYKIDFGDSEKNEIRYRLIEAGKINNVADYEKIEDALLEDDIDILGIK